MFIGHYGVSFAAKRFTPRTSLGSLFLSGQLLDVLFSIFVLAGLEQLRIVPGFTAYNPYDLVYMSLSHSFVGSLAWAAIAGAVMAALRGRTMAFACQALFLYVLLAGVAAWSDRRPSA
jgi:hypothetical protein